MLALIDSSVLIAGAIPRETRHEIAAGLLLGSRDKRLAVPVTILAETMSFILARHGIHHQRAVWDRILDSDLEVLPADSGLLADARRIDRAYADAGFGFADCVLLATCERERTARVMSFDRRLALYKPSFAGSLELIP